MSATVLQNRLKAIRLRTAAAVEAEWDDLPDLERDHAEPFARRAVKIVTAGQLLTAKTTAAYLARIPGLRPVRPTVDNVTGRAARNVDPLEEYQRPFGAAWAEFGNGADYQTARAAGRTRASVLAVADTWLAMRATAALVDAANSRITGWVRVADAGACDLCSAADGQTMAAAADMAGHPGCGCTAEPQTSANDATSEATDPEAFTVHQHDEMGPQLTAAGHGFAA